MIYNTRTRLYRSPMVRPVRVQQPSTNSLARRVLVDVFNFIFGPKKRDEQPVHVAKAPLNRCWALCQGPKLLWPEIKMQKASPVARKWLGSSSRASFREVRGSPKPKYVETWGDWGFIPLYMESTRWKKGSPACLYVPKLSGRPE